MSGSFKYDEVPPRADALMESLRAFGYSPEAAIADLVDNSLTANARHIDLNFCWDGSDSWIAVRDDGSGMTESDLVEAMRPGTHNPRDVRSSKDLGRFGLGLKTASWSQSRSLTVISKNAGTARSVRRWDLDYVGTSQKWHLLRDGSEIADQLSAELGESDSGTIVLWEKMDQILEVTGRSGSQAEDRFLTIAAAVEEHLAMVYHRFLQGTGRVRMTINKREISAWDPFLSAHPATQQLIVEDRPAFGSVVGVAPFVLPHHSKLTPEEHRSAAGPRGWNAHQGFFVYRNRRLLVAGSWLKLGFRKEEHYKLARIRIDLPNSMDEQWSLNVTKSAARPPGILRQDLKRIAKLTRARAVEVYRHRGKRVAMRAGQSGIHAWSRQVRDGLVSYRINRKYPLIEQLLKSTSGKAFRRALRILEETVPVQTIFIDAAEKPDSHAGPFENVSQSDIESLLYDILTEYLGNGWDLKTAGDQLVRLEPFQDYGEAIGHCVAVLESEIES